MLKKVFSWTSLIILILAIPVATYLIKQQQILKSRADVKLITFFGTGISEKDGQIYADNLTVQVKLSFPPIPSPPSTPPPAPPLLISNPGFEEDKNNWWIWDPSEGKWTIDQTDKHSGQSSAKIQLGKGLCASCGNTHTACINQGRHKTENADFWNPTLWAGKTFKFSYWYKSTPSVSPALQVALRTGPNDSDLTTYWYPDGILSNNPSTTWTEASKNITIPATYNGKPVTAFDISLCASTPENGPAGEAAQVWFDEFNITPSNIPEAIIPDSYTVSFKLAENPLDFGQSIAQPYISDPLEIEYTFKNPNSGIKTLFVEFIGQNGEKQQAQTSIIYQPPAPSPTPKPTPIASNSEDKSGLGTTCNVGVNYEGNENRYASWNKTCTGPVQTGGSEGIGQNCCELACGANRECDEESPDQGNCNSACQPISREPVYLKSFLENMPAQGKAKYDVKDNKNNGLDTIKIIENPTGGYLGIYHYAINGVFYLKLAKSSDLLNWTHIADLDSYAGFGDIQKLSDNGFLAVYEKIAAGGELGPNWIRFRYYKDLSSLLAGNFQKEFNARRSLSPAAEGTPNIYSVNLSPDIDNSQIDLEFHYYRNSSVDRQAKGKLTNFSSWEASVETDLNNKLDSLVGEKGGFGDRDDFVFQNKQYLILEAQSQQGDFGTWRTYLYNRKTGTTQLLELKTPHNAKGFANPTLTILTSPEGKKVAVATFFIFGATAPGEGGPSIFYRELSDAAVLPIQPPQSSPLPDKLSLPLSVVQKAVKSIPDSIKRIVPGLQGITNSVIYEPTPVPSPIPSSDDLTGDLNGDKKTNAADLSILYSSWGKQTTQSKYPQTDLNKDGVTNSLDYTIFLNYFIQNNP